MAQIIPFPGVVLPSPPEQQSEPALRSKPKSIATEAAVVCHIRGWKRVPKKNRPEDDNTIMIARMAQGFADKAYALAQSEPNSERHRMVEHMAGISAKLPRNNLRIFTTPEDVVQGIWNLWRQVKIANLEWELCDERRCEAAFSSDEAGRAHWSQKQDEADAHRWMIYERLVRVPATRLWEITTYKLDRRFQRGMGSLEWMRVHKPEIAAVIDDDVARLAAEKEQRKMAREAKKQREA